jgi:hypothetical protein
VPVLSSSLVASLQSGRHFVMSLRLAAPSPSPIPTPSFRITADLQAGIGGAGVAVLHQCGVPNDTLAAGANKAR